jgi:hypothetical protein
MCTCTTTSAPLIGWRLEPRLYQTTALQPCNLTCNHPLVHQHLPSTMTTLRDAGIYGDFVHEPLSNPQREIRLVQVEPPDKDQDDSEIYCTISAHQFKPYAYKDPPPVPYIAISYIWGDTSKKRGIWINKKRLNIGHNSWLAIWQARLHCPQQPLRLWIDVLSIDQANDNEKSVQVSLMGDIFKAAKCVLASVGVHGGDSEFLVQEVLAHAEYIEHWRVLQGQKEDPPAVKSGCCPDCGQSLVSRQRLCNSCYDQNPGFEYDLRNPRCDMCLRRFTIRWYRLPFGVKLCKTCKVLHHGETNEGSQARLFDALGAVDEPAGSYEARYSSPWDTHVRFVEMSRDTRQRILDALAVFSLRPYFSRLWVCVCLSHGEPGPQTDSLLIVPRLSRKSKFMIASQSFAASLCSLKMHFFYLSAI